MERGGSMLYIYNYNLKEGKMEEFQKFIKENEKAIAKQAPKGWKYLGTLLCSGVWAILCC